MAKIVVFHSALGLRPAIERLGAVLRDDGHRVWTPDLFDGQVFSDLGKGVAERDRLGIPELMTRAAQAVSTLPDDLVYLGFSMGTGPAQLLAATRPGARGAVLVQGVLPPELLGVESWPEDVPVQLHISRDDPWHDQASLDAFTKWVPAELLDQHEHPGCDHLFADQDLAVYDATAAERLVDAVREWMRGHAGG